LRNQNPAKVAEVMRMFMIGMLLIFIYFNSLDFRGFLV